MHRYKTWNGPMATSAAQQAVTTGTAIKTMLQIATPSTRQIQLISWGFSIDDPAGADGEIELIETGSVGATVTAHVAAGLQPLDPNAPASLMSLGVALTGYTASAEGTVVASRCFDAVSLNSAVGGEAGATQKHVYQFMPDERPIVGVSRTLRVRATTPTTAVDLRCWICWDE